MKTNIYEQITNAIIAELEKGIIPWQKPWENGVFMGCISHTNGKPYSLLNQWLLEGKAGEWLTYGQIQAEGGRIKKGEKAHIVVFWSWVDKTEKNEETGEEKIVGKYPLLKAYNVWHITQTEDIEAKYRNEPKMHEHEPIKEAERVSAAYVEREQLRLVVTDSERAFYSSARDMVQVPKMKQFKDREEYYSTLFHELTHSTGHVKRLARREVGTSFFGSTDYSKEELVAEMGAAFICQTLGIESAKAFRNSAAYIQSWLRALRNDKKMMVEAAAKAEKAVQYILNRKEGVK